MIFISNSGNDKSFGEDSFYPMMASELFDNYLNVINESLNYVKPEYPEVNIDLSGLIGELSGNNLGIYSLNYDFLIPELFKEELGIFDGFELKTIDSKKNWIPDHRRIAANYDKIKYYNLHGSLRFKNGYLVNHKHEFHLSDKYEWSPYEKIHSENTFYLPIVTGGNKLFKTLVSPMKYFFSAFHQDLSRCDQLVIIGYSFSDKHINDLIVDLVPENKKLLIVDFASNETDKLEKIQDALRPWRDFVPEGRNLLYSDINSNCFCYLGGASPFLKDYQNIINDTLYKVNF